jgi:hypothetical protein
VSFAGELNTGASGAGVVVGDGIGVGTPAGLGAQLKLETKITLAITTKNTRSRIVDIIHLLNNIPYEKQ